mgnify:CR=1 FL=1|tara:strand:+ start:712 stop:981 length:270 start_codon:yes stop_codon:yes gene_type:complete
MTKEDTLINLGNDSEQLVKSEIFNKVINRMVEGTFQAFVNSKPEDTKVRDKTYDHYRALVDIVNTLNQDVQVKDEILAKYEKDNNSQEE